MVLHRDERDGEMYEEGEVQTPLIAIVDADVNTSSTLDAALSAAGYRTIICREGKNAHPLLRRVQPDLVVLDLELEHPCAAGMVLGLLELDPSTQTIPVIVCAPSVGPDTFELDLFRVKGHIVLELPAVPATLMSQIEQALPA